MTKRPKPLLELPIESNYSDIEDNAASHPEDVGVVGFRVVTLQKLQWMSDELVRMTSEVEQLNGLLRKYRSPLYMLSQRDVIVIEAFLSLASLWAAFTLWHVPTLFESFPGTFRLIEALHGSESSWALFAFIAAITKIIGLMTCLTSDTTWGRIARYVGLAMSGLFWSVMGGGVLLGNPNTLFGFNSLLMGLFSWWSLLRLVK
jgi:hypothetical protein